MIPKEQRIQILVMAGVPQNVAAHIIDQVDGTSKAYEQLVVNLKNNISDLENENKRLSVENAVYRESFIESKAQLLSKPQNGPVSSSNDTPLADIGYSGGVV